MKLACQICDKIISYDGVLKGQKAFSYTIAVDQEPYINTAIPSIHSGVLCYQCSQRIGNILGIVTK